MREPDKKLIAMFRPLPWQCYALWLAILLILINIGRLQLGTSAPEIAFQALGYTGACIGFYAACIFARGE